MEKSFLELLKEEHRLLTQVRGGESCIKDWKEEFETCVDENRIESLTYLISSIEESLIKNKNELKYVRNEIKVYIEKLMEV